VFLLAGALLLAVRAPAPRVDTAPVGG